MSKFFSRKKSSSRKMLLLKDDFKYNFKYDMIKITVKMRIEFNLMKYKNDIRIMFI